MGQVDGELETGLPDGEYCDLVSECRQTITVSGGRAHIKPHDQAEPVVALCVGCGETQPGTTSNPHTTSPPKPTTTTKRPAPTTQGSIPILCQCRKLLRLRS